jgi:hypothetical protein
MAYGGLPPEYAPYLAQQQQQASQDDQAQQRLQAEIEQRNAELSKPNEFETLAINGGYVPGSPEWAALMRHRAQAQADPMTMTPYGPVPYSQLSGAAQPPAQPVGPLTDYTGN